MIYLFDKAEALYSTVNADDLREAYYEESINSAGILRATMSAQLVIPTYVAHRDVVNPSSFLMYKVTKFSEDGDLLTIEAIESAYDDLKADGIVQDYRPTGRTVKQVSDTILSASRWSTGTVSSTKTVTDTYYFMNRLDAILELLKGGLEVRFRVIITGSQVTGRFVDWYDSIGEDRGRRYVHGGGLLKVEREEDRSDIYTALIGRGKGTETYDDEGNVTGFGRRTTFDSVVWTKASGKPVNKPAGQIYVEIPERTAEYGYPNGKPRIGVLELTDISDPEELLTETYNQLEIMSRPLVTYSANVRDEGTTGLGDTVGIIRGGIRYKTRIYRRTVDLLRPKNVKIELGDKIQSYTAKKLSELSRQIETRTEEAKTSAFERAKAYMYNAELTYWGENGYNYDLKTGNQYGLPAGLYSFDLPIDQAYTKWIYFGAGKLVISDTKNPDGTWKLKTILDGSGLGVDTVGANQIISGSVDTDHLKAGAINTNMILIGEDGSTLSQKLTGVDNLQAELTQAVQSGGVNLVFNSDFRYGQSGRGSHSSWSRQQTNPTFNTSGTVTFIDSSQMYQAIGASGRIALNDLNSISVKARGHGQFQMRWGGQSYVSDTTVDTDEWQVFSNSLPNAGNGNLIIGTSSGEVEVEWVIMVKGAIIPTAYSRSPEDIEYDIEAVRLESANALNTYAQTVTAELTDLQGQVDGAISTWFYAVPPALNLPPSNAWTDVDTKNIHLGDLYYDTITGYVYRWQIKTGVHSWQRITDTDVTKALADASKAQDTADNKRRVFVAQPVPPYDVGDLWTQGESGEILRCTTSRATGAYQSSDWVLASKYTDDTTAEEAKGIAEAVTTKFTKLELGEITLGEITDINGRIATIQSTIKAVDNTLQTTVTSDELATAIENLDTVLAGKADSEDFAELNEGWVTVVNDLRDWRVVYQNVEDKQGEHEDSLMLVKKFMEFDENFLTIGASTSSTRVQVTDSAINFIDGGEVVAYITGKTLYINQATIVSSLQVGNHILERNPEDLDHTTFRWIGG